MVKNPTINQTNLATSLFLFLLGGVGFLASSSLPMGSAMQMGAGYVPRLLSYLLMAFGLAVLVLAFRSAGERLERWSLRPLLCILAVPVLFASVIETLGLPITVILCTVLSSLAASEMRGKEVILVAVGMAAFAYLLFVTALGLPMRFLPVW